jgi:hypothetical protein
MKKILFTLLLLTLFSPSKALPSFGGGFEDVTALPTEAYVCSNCSSATAKAIALNNAPKNTCHPYANGSVAEFCPAVTKDILVPALGSKVIYKYTVTTNIDASGRQSANAFPGFVTATEYELMAEYFYQYDLIEQAVAEASISIQNNAFGSYSSVNKRFNSSSQSSTTSDSCDTHPISYFKSDEAKSSKKLDLGSRILENMGSDSPAEYVNERLLNSFGLGVSASGANITVGGQYVPNELIVTEGDNGINVLAFNVHVAQNPITKVNQVALTINRLFTKIDGTQMSDFFGPTWDLTSFDDYQVSGCVSQFIEENTTLADSQTDGSGGDGSEENPFVGIDTLGKDSSTEYCRFRTEARSCSTTRDGMKTCITTIFFSNKPCNTFNVGG